MIDQMRDASEPTGRWPRLYIAEDDADDRLLIKDALLDCGISDVNFTFFEDGEALLEGLLQHPLRRGIVLLDLNMPRKDGRQALQEIKVSDRLKHIPVIVLTTSSAVEDVHLTYRLGGNTFFTKPSRYEDLLDIVSTIKAYWLERARLDSPVD